MNANEITFGVEIECYLPEHNIDFAVGSYHCGAPIDGLPEGWNAQRDGSLNSPPAVGYRGVEIVSGILKGKDGLAQIKTVCDWLRSKGAKVNRSTGLHIHVGFRHQSARALAQLVCIVARNEKALFAMTGTKSRENPDIGRQNFCKSIRSSFRVLAKKGKLDDCNPARVDRYHLLNLSKLANGGPTVEFRCFAGTVNWIKIKGYAQVCVALVQKAINTKGKVSFDAPPLRANGRVTKQGEGETAVNRLFYSLFWKFGSEFRPTSDDPKWNPIGVLEPETLALSGRLLLKLARQYDGNDAETEDAAADAPVPTPPSSPNVI